MHPGDNYISLEDVTQSADLLGAVARVPVTVPEGRLTHDTVKLISKSDPRFTANCIYSVAATRQYRADCLAQAIGTTESLNILTTSCHSLYLPPLEEQREIAHILGSLDDKIELNRQMNVTLEATARAIFKSWFVDFDPVHAKANGEQPVGMDAEIAALFPNSFEDSELGLIPQGWRAALRDVAEINSVTLGEKDDLI